MAFASIPIIDISLASDPSTKPALLVLLRHAIIDVGFLYIKNFGIEQELLDDVSRYGQAFFDLPTEEKLRIEMKNGPHFLGYSRLGMEVTARKTDFREQIDFGTEMTCPTAEDPQYRWLYGIHRHGWLTVGPNMWPKEELLRGFRDTFERYMTSMGDVADTFTRLVAEAIGLPTDSFDPFFEPKDGKWKQQHKLKIVKYPDISELPAGSTTQGVGPHKGILMRSR
jgi:isopenicillin N synthase-like dioxygenase